MIVNIFNFTVTVPITIQIKLNGLLQNIFIFVIFLILQYLYQSQFKSN